MESSHVCKPRFPSLQFFRSISIPMCSDKHLSGSSIMRSSLPSTFSVVRMATMEAFSRSSGYAARE
eukprot:6212678-Pleurochrysis_carterae.AAC.1